MTRGLGAEQESPVAGELEVAEETYVLAKVLGPLQTRIESGSQANL